MTWHTSNVTDANPYRDLPSVDELASGFAERLPWPVLVELAREAISRSRSEMDSGENPDVREVMEKAVEAKERSAGLRLINATGVLLHTNLGRAPWPESAIAAHRHAAGNYTNLELDVASGLRGGRGDYVASLLRALTGAEDALVVNNNAGAVLLALAALADARSVPVSRGELIEIGGAYRLPDVMKASGARLVEVGTTNRTRLGDYETAIQVYDCGAVLKIHPSNYSIEGFTTEVGVGDLAELAGSTGVPLIHDLGSGLLDEATPWLDGSPPVWLRGEPGARQSIEKGVELVTFSGDKLLGGPQAGIVVGRSETVRKLREHPMARALRVDGPSLAALGAVLKAYADGDVTPIPFWRMALAPLEDIKTRAEVLATRVGGKVVEGASAVGAGSAPNSSIPSAHVVLTGADSLYKSLLALDTPIVARRESGALVLDLRTVDPPDDDLLADGIAECR